MFMESYLSVSAFVWLFAMIHVLLTCSGRRMLVMYATKLVPIMIMIAAVVHSAYLAPTWYRFCIGTGLVFSLCGDYFLWGIRPGGGGQHPHPSNPTKAAARAFQRESSHPASNCLRRVQQMVTGDGSPVPASVKAGLG